MNRKYTRVVFTVEEAEKNKLNIEADELDMPLSLYLRFIVTGLIKRGDAKPKDFNK